MFGQSRSTPPHEGRIGPLGYDEGMEIHGTGIDLVDVQRIGSMIEEHGQRFLDRCFTFDEQAYCDDAPKRRFEHYAARFACKEAVLKVLGTGWRDGIAWTDIEVQREPSGRPRLSISGRCAEIAADIGITIWHISLSHTDTLAIASALGCGLTPPSEARIPG